MANDFTIRATIRTVDGFEPLCDFYLGHNPVLAAGLFSQLEGNDEVVESDVLQLDLVEKRKGLPVNVKIKHCSLQQLGRNCCMIARELFKHRNLDHV